MVRGGVRITYRRRHSYRTASNRIKPVKTPGGRLIAHYIPKKVNGPKCGDTGVRLFGIRSLKQRQMARVSHNERTVARAYGGTKSANAVRDRILRAFLIEEQKVAKKIVAERIKKSKKKSAKEE